MFLALIKIAFVALLIYIYFAIYIDISCLKFIPGSTKGRKRQCPHCLTAFSSHLLGVCVEGDRHVEQQLPVFHSPNKVLDPDLQVSGCFVDFLWVTFTSLSQLLGCLQQFVCVSVSVLEGERALLSSSSAFTSK